MAQPDAVQILLANIQDVLAAFRENGEDTRKTFTFLAGKIPAIGAMEWNTFRTRLSVVVSAWEAGHAFQSDTVRDLEREIAGLREELASARSEIGQIQQGQRQAGIGTVMSGQIVADTEIPKTMEGWSINQHKRGFWRAFRKVQGKSRCVYLGMKFDPLAAREKLVAANAGAEALKNQ